jgi:hypothetical protein
MVAIAMVLSWSMVLSARSAESRSVEWIEQLIDVYSKISIHMLSLSTARNGVEFGHAAPEQICDPAVSMNTYNSVDRSLTQLIATAPKFGIREQEVARLRTAHSAWVDLAKFHRMIWADSKGLQPVDRCMRPSDAAGSALTMESELTAVLKAVVR